LVVRASALLRLTLGAGAVGALGWLAFTVFASPGLRLPAVVEAASTLSLSAIESGHYRLSVRSGEPPGGDGLVFERMLLFDNNNNELVEVSLRSDLRTGARLRVGDEIATVRSLHSSHRADELEAARAALIAQRNLLVAGESDEAVAEARERVRLALAVRAAGTAELTRLRRLAAAGLVSTSELEAAEMTDRVRAVEIAVAEATVRTSSASARPEALVALDAEIAVAEARLAEARALCAEERVLSPVEGVVVVGGGSRELRVLRLDPVFLEIPLPVDRSAQVEKGAGVRFSASALPGRVFVGRVVGVSDSVIVISGQAVVWASARLANPNEQLRPGMTGTAEILIRDNR